MAGEAGTGQETTVQPTVSKPDILIRYEPALSSTSDHPTGPTPPAPALRQGPQASVGPAGENAPPPEKVAEPSTETKPDTPAPKPEEVAADAAEAAAETAAKSAGKKPFSERISDIAKARDEAVARATAAEAKAAEAARVADERLAKLTEQVEALVKQNTKPDPLDIKPARPDRAAFDSPQAYDAAMDAFIEQTTAWSARQGQKAAEQSLAEQKKADAEAAAAEASTSAAEKSAAAVVERFQAAQAKAIEKHADFVQTVSNKDLPITTPMAHAILQAAEDGTEVMYYLGKHPEEAARIAALTPEPTAVQEAHIAISRAAIEIGKLAATLAAAPKAEVSKTPAPIAPVGARGASGHKTLSEMSMDEYATTVPEYVASRDARAAVGGRKSAVTLQ